MNPIILNTVFLSLLILALIIGRYKFVHSKSYLSRINRKIDSEELMAREKPPKICRKQRKLAEQKKLAEAEKAEKEKRRLQKSIEDFRVMVSKLDEDFSKETGNHITYNDIPESTRSILEELATGKKYCILPIGEHRDSVIANWLKYSGKKRLLVVTAREKVTDHQKRAAYFDKFCGEGAHKAFDSLELISWDDLAEWYHEHSKKCIENPDCCLCEYAIAFDEVHNAKAGNTSERGMAFLSICEETTDWIGLSAEMGNNWGGYTTFFVATKIFENSSDFEEKYAYYTYMPNGDKFVAGYSDTSTLLKMWNGISVAA